MFKLWLLVTFDEFEDLKSDGQHGFKYSHMVID